MSQGRRIIFRKDVAVLLQRREGVINIRYWIWEILYCLTIYIGREVCHSKSISRVSATYMWRCSVESGNAVCGTFVKFVRITFIYYNLLLLILKIFRNFYFLYDRIVLDLSNWIYIYKS